MIDVATLRHDARTRADRRPRVPFDGTIRDERIAEVAVRRYVPQVASRALTIVFAHGGYGLFGDLDLQDGLCRAMAHRLECPVVSVDYRLAPEHTFVDATSDVMTCAQALEGAVALCGDSAGGAVVVESARMLGTGLKALLLANPNLDLTLELFDAEAPEGPNEETSREAFTAWMRPLPLERASRLHLPATALPPTLIGVGSHDALVPEARAFADSCLTVGSPCDLQILNDTGHGFMGVPERADVFLTKSAQFLDRFLPREDTKDRPQMS